MQETLEGNWEKEMYNITLSVLENTVEALQVAPENLRSEMLLMAAIQLYELCCLSSGTAANLAGIPRVLFLSKLADYNVDTFRLTEAELAEDLANA